MRAHITQIINGIRYSTEAATVLASNEYWDGSNWERGGTNLHLYRSAHGRYFVGHSTQWQGQRDYIEVLTEEEAVKLYEDLPEYELSYEEAFPGRGIEEA